MYAAVAFGLTVVGISVSKISLERIDFYFALLFCFTIFLGSRVTIPIPQLKSHIAVSDIFVFLALLLYGGALAIPLAAVEAFCASWRFCNKKFTVLFNASVAAISTGSVVLALHVLDLDYRRSDGGGMQDFVLMLCTMALVHFAVNTGLAALYDSFLTGKAFWEVWEGKYLWSFVTFLIGAIGAGVIVELTGKLGLGVIVAACPIILLVYASYRMYLTTVRLSIEQAEQAEGYAKLLEEQSLALRESEERFRSAFTNAPIGIALVSFDGKWLKVNTALCEILGYTEGELLSSTFSPFTYPDDLLGKLVDIQQVICGSSQSCQREVRYVHRSGKTVWTNLNVSATEDIKSPNCSLVFQIQDITEKKMAAEKLQHEATHDALTGLPNRAHFMKRLDQALQRMRENPKYRVSVLFIDLDRFKYVNDSLGHHVGDELLCAIAERLRASMRPPDLVARLGGDEFVVLVEGRYYAEKITRIADRIQKKISSPFKLQGHEAFTSASIGILNATEQHRTADDIIRDADTAMYHAKRSGKARHETFDDNMRDAMRETLQLETDLRKAIQSNELEVYYQPIFSLSDERVYGLEALARWKHPERGSISPERFVPLAEEIGLIDDLSDLVLRKACSDVVGFRTEMPEHCELKLSVNLSSKQFSNEGLVRHLSSILHEASFPADRLKIEITESVFFEQHERALDTLARLREIGIETDIDDFGTGYSNLGYLVRLPISTLKIDRSFVMMMAENSANREVIRTVISLARNLGLKVVAEGIETSEHRDALRTLGCDLGQGFFYERPMNAQETAEFLRNARPKGTFSEQDFEIVPQYSTIQ